MPQPTLLQMVSTEFPLEHKYCFLKKPPKIPLCLSISSTTDHQIRKTESEKEL